MTNVIISENGESYDLHTAKGCYEYISMFLIKNNAGGDVLSSLEKLYNDLLLKKEN